MNADAGVNFDKNAYAAANADIYFITNEDVDVNLNTKSMWMVYGEDAAADIQCTSKLEG